MDYFKDKKILITGIGTIGSAIGKELVTKHNTKLIRMVDNSELKIHQIRQQYPNGVEVIFADIRNKKDLCNVMTDIDIVFHTAAMKHVRICEEAPIDAIKTNILGTQNVIDSAVRQGVEKVVIISTDKAVSPTSVMGATKFISEKLLSSQCVSIGNKETALTSVRFGNVLNSSGSVIQIFKKQIDEGKPLTVTNPEMTRFVMTIEEAVNLILVSASISVSGDKFILKMPSVKIGVLAKACIEYFSPHSNVEVKIIGQVEGEKLHEELMTKEEIGCAYENDKMFVITRSSVPYGFMKTKVKDYTSNNTRLLSVTDIKKILGELRYESS
jgi:FlaA1/EpsC-like NDP-sugar epimerase